MSNTIVLKGTGIQNEGVAAAAITPGFLVQETVAGVAPHAIAGGNAEKAFAIEDELQGKGISDDYAVGTRVQYRVMERGAEVYAFLNTGEVVVAGDALESAGNGMLRKFVAAAAIAEVKEDRIVGYARESVDASAGAARLTVRVA